MGWRVTKKRTANFYGLENVAAPRRRGGRKGKQRVDAAFIRRKVPEKDRVDL